MSYSEESALLFSAVVKWLIKCASLLKVKVSHGSNNKLFPVNERGLYVPASGH